MFIMFWLLVNLVGIIRIGLGLAFYGLGSLENFGLNASNVLDSDCVACTEFGMSMLDCLFAWPYYITSEINVIESKVYFNVL